MVEPSSWDGIRLQLPRQDSLSWNLWCKASPSTYWNSKAFSQHVDIFFSIYKMKHQYPVNINRRASEQDRLWRVCLSDIKQNKQCSPVTWPPRYFSRLTRLLAGQQAIKLNSTSVNYDPIKTRLKIMQEKTQNEQPLLLYECWKGQLYELLNISMKCSCINPPKFATKCWCRRNY